MNTHLISGMVGAAVLLTSVGTAVRAQEVSPPTLAAWSTRVFDKMARETKYPQPIGPMPASTGIVAVKFNCSEGGAPENVTLYKSSGHHDLDVATLKAVRRIASLHPLPAGMTHNQGIIVRVLYATSEDVARRQMAQMRTDAARANAWFGKSPTATAALELAPSGS